MDLNLGTVPTEQVEFATFLQTHGLPAITTYKALIRQMQRARKSGNSVSVQKGLQSEKEASERKNRLLMAWLLSPENVGHPYPTPQDKIMLVRKTGIDKKQLNKWFVYTRRNTWKPMMKRRQEERGIQPTTGTDSDSVSVSASLPANSRNISGNKRRKEIMSGDSDDDNIEEEKKPKKKTVT